MVKSSILFALSNSYRSLVLILLLPLWTFYFSPAEIGIFAVILTAGQILSRIGGCGLAAATSRYYIDLEGDTSRLKVFISSVVALSTISVLIVGAIGSFFGEEVNSWLLGADSSNYWWYILGLFISMLVVNLQMALFVVRGEAGKTFLITVVPQTLGLIVSLLLVAYFLQGLGGRLTGLIAGEGIAAIICLVFLFRQYVGLTFSWSDAKLALLFGLPLMLHSASQLLLQSGDRFVLLKYADAANVGLYTVATSLSSGLLLIQGAVNQSWAPKYLRRLKLRSETDSPQVIEGVDEEVKKFFKLWVAFFGFVAFSLILLGPEVLLLLASDPSYRAADNFLGPLVLGCFATGIYFFGVNYVMHLKKTKLIPIVTGGCMILNILLNVGLIPVFGPLAAAWTTLVCNLILALVFNVLSIRAGAPRLPFLNMMGVVGIIIASMFIKHWLGGEWPSIMVLLLLKVGLIMLAGLVLFYPHANLIRRKIKSLLSGKGT